MADGTGLKRRVLGTLHKISSHPVPQRKPPVDKVPVKDFSMSQCVCIQLFKDGKTLTAFVPNDCLLGFLDEDDQVTISGLGCCGEPSEGLEA